jgi:hypothetical protein
VAHHYMRNDYLDRGILPEVVDRELGVADCNSWDILGRDEDHLDAVAGAA